MVSIPGEIQKRFDGRIRRITAAGVELPPEFIELRERAASRHITGTPLRDRYVAALVSNDQKADMAALWAMSLAEACADNQLRAAVDEGVRDGVNERLRELYAPHAKRVYDELAAKFNDAAAGFSTAAALVDPELDPANVLRLDKNEQQAWFDADTHAKTMTALLPALGAAALLAGIGDFDANPDELLSLVVDPEGHDRQALWRAWEIEEREAQALREAETGSPFTRPTVTQSRCGRWSATAKLGAKIRAVDINHFWAYERREPVTDPDAPPIIENSTHHMGRVPENLLRAAAQ